MSNCFRFMESDPIRHIDSTLRTAPYRMFVGHSLGGLAAIGALYRIPETFNSYVAIDPSLWWDRRLLLNQAKAFFERPQPAGRKYHPDDSHGSVPMIAEYDALRYIFAGYALDVQRAISAPAYLAAHIRRSVEADGLHGPSAAYAPALAS